MRVEVRCTIMYTACHQTPCENIGASETKTRRCWVQNNNNKHEQCNAIYLPQKTNDGKTSENANLRRNRRQQIYIVQCWWKWCILYCGWWWLKRRRRQRQCWWWRWCWWWFDAFVFYHRWMHTHIDEKRKHLQCCFHSSLCIRISSSTG